MTLREDLSAFFDAQWYVSEYPDVAASGSDPLTHYLHYGAGENRNPNPFFDAAWYLAQYPDVARAGLNPLVHYLRYGAAELRNPHPRFDAAFYADEHPEAAANPLLFHVLHGAKRGWATERVVDPAEFLPSRRPLPVCPPGLVVDVVIPVYRGLEETRRCLESVLADPDRPPGEIVVIDDRSPEPVLSAWLDEVNATGRIRLIRHRRNQGFVVSVNRGMALSARNDVVLLNSDTEVPPGWLRRLAGHAYGGRRVGSVSPLSNNATICSYPVDAGGPLPFGLSGTELDAACREANAGRSVPVPTTVGFCMYIRRDCLRETGPFDAATFGRGYGEENDFCLRSAAAGWTHLLACDTFVYHAGSVSFGPGSPDLEGKLDLLRARYPQFDALVQRHIRRDQVGPYRFALTAALFRRSGLPTVLFVAHGLGGGVREHMDVIAARAAGRANFLLLTSEGRAARLTALGAPHPGWDIGEDREADLAAYLRSAAVARVHVHHVLGLRLDLRRLIDLLGVPFDFTAHDFLTICPQINLLPRRDGQHCDQPEPAGCNACIAENPGAGARDILSWRADHAWLLREAERVICPSADTRERLARYGLAERAVVWPHAPVATGAWRLRPRRLGRAAPLRIALLGVLADHKGGRTVAAVLDAADPERLDLRLLGYVEDGVAYAPALARLPATGRYEPAALPSLLAEAAPHVVWLPAQWPETYSYTLSAALAAGLPVVAARIGAFTERLAGRPLTWLVDPAAPAAEWLAAFEAARAALASGGAVPRAARPTAADHYGTEYLPDAPALRGAGPRDLRRPDRTTVIVVPERLGDGSLSPCSYIRLLLPLDHPAIGDGLAVMVARPEEALRLRGDVLLTQRYATGDAATSARLAAHCRATGMRLLYDIDDDLLGIPDDHADAADLRPRAEAVEALLAAADGITVSTEPLKAALGKRGRRALVVPNGLDERLWQAVPQAGRAPYAPLRVLFMGTATHDADLALVLPAIERLREELGEAIAFTVLGVTARALPEWIERPRLPTAATASYPGFVNWMIQQHAWDVGIAPLVDTPFTRSKSAIKALDYAALGLAVLASDVPAYRGSLADGAGGMLVAESGAAWHEAIGRLGLDWALRARLREGARRAFPAFTLAAQAEQRRRAFAALLGAARPRVAA